MKFPEILRKNIQLKKSRQKLGIPKKMNTEMQTKWDHYHWNETFTNHEGLSLRECMNRYGVGGWYSTRKDMVVALVFLCADKSAGNSWLLGIKQINGEQRSVRVHDDEPYTYNLSPDTSLGTNIYGLLADCVFENASEPKTKRQKQKPNEQCACNSGKKYKKG